MPRLIIFAVCERTIIDTEGNVSLVGLMRSVTVGRRPGAPETKIATNAVGPKEWSVFYLWKPGPGDYGGKEFVSVIEVLWPDKTQFNRESTPFQFTEGKDTKVVLSIIGFPLGQPGEVIINMWLEQDSKRIGEVYCWAVQVIHEI